MQKDDGELDDHFWRDLLTVGAVYVALFCCFAVMTGCAWTDRELDDATTKVNWFGQFFGPQGVVASGAITATMVAAVQIYRSVTGPARYEKYAKLAAQKKAKAAQAAAAKAAVALQGNP